MANDARGIAEMMRAGHYRPVQEKSTEANFSAPPCKRGGRSWRRFYTSGHNPWPAADARPQSELKYTGTSPTSACLRLMTVPGVGAITSLAFRVTVDDPARFNLSKAVANIARLRIYCQSRLP
jgi:arylamine N-acetyltransferase